MMHFCHLCKVKVRNPAGLAAFLCLHVNVTPVTPANVLDFVDRSSNFCLSFMPIFTSSSAPSLTAHDVLPPSLKSTQHTSSSENTGAPASDGSGKPVQRPPHSIHATADKWAALHRNYVNAQNAALPRMWNAVSKISREAGVEILTAATTTAAIVVLPSLIRQVYPALASSADLPASGGDGSAANESRTGWDQERTALINGASVVAGTVAKELVPALVRAIQRTFFAEDKWAEVEVLRHIYQAFVEDTKDYLRDASVPQENKDALRQLITSLAGKFETLDAVAKNTAGPGLGVVKDIRQNLELFVWTLGIPLMPKNASHMERHADSAATRKTLEARQRIDKKVAALLANYDPQIQSRLGDYIASIRHNSAKGSEARSSLLYLAGAGGTGKSYLAKAIAEALELPYIKVMAKGKTLREMFGESSTFGVRATMDVKVLNDLGEFLTQLILSGHSNPIIHLEEFGDEFTDPARIIEILQDLKVRLDREAVEIAPLFGALLRNAGNIVASSNRNLDSDTVSPQMRPSLSALMSRMTYIEMPPVPVALKRTLAEKAWDESINVLKNNANRWELVDALKDRVIGMVLSEDAERMVPGTRHAERIGGAIAAQIFHRKFNGIYDMSSAGHTVSDTEIEAMIKASYDESLLKDTEPKPPRSNPFFGGFGIEPLESESPASEFGDRTFAEAGVETDRTPPSVLPEAERAGAGVSTRAGIGPQSASPIVVTTATTATTAPSASEGSSASPAAAANSPAPESSTRAGKSFARFSRSFGTTKKTSTGTRDTQYT